jgi:hypothetical protein
MANDPIFVLGMPRCRTAWLSVCLSALGVNCSHEGIRDHADFEDFAEELEERLGIGPAGDSDPTAVYWLDKILVRWPAAKFVVVYREDTEALEALVAAAPPELRQPARASWSGYLTAFKSACDRLRARGNAQFFELEKLGETADELFEFATGRKTDARWLRRMQRLRVTSLIEAIPAPALERPPLAVKLIEGFDTSGLTATLFRASDFELVARWWRQHTGDQLAQAALPPLGVLVSDGEGPMAALWCYECYGVPVAELAYPVTRPGLGIKKASTAICYAVGACIAAAGKGHTPEASFRFFKAFALKSAVRYMTAMGFKEALTDRVAMTLTL